MKKLVLSATIAAALLTAVPSYSATIVFNQDFETDTAGVIPYTSSVNRYASGTPSIVGSQFHAVIGETSPDYTGAFTRFDGYRSVWPDGFIASIDIYLDTGWALGSGFDYSVAASGSDGDHQRDFIFHVAQDTSTGDLIVGGSNNTNFATREDLDNLNNYAVVDTSGWYTFQHVFYTSLDGSLAVDLNLIRDGSLLFTETRNNASDLIPSEVGGNRYGWFTFIDVASGISVDNIQLTIGTEAATVPEPGTMILLGSGLLVTAVSARKRKES